MSTDRITFTPEQQAWIDKKIAAGMGVVKAAKRKGFTTEQLDSAVAKFTADMNAEFETGRAITNG